MSSQFHVYRLEYSNQRHDGAYVRFDRESTVDSDDHTYGSNITSNNWIWSNFSSCNGEYDADANRCSLLAPFDNPMNIVIDIVVGGNVGGWLCATGLRESDYNVFDRGVEIEISKIVVSALNFEHCS